MQPDFNRLKVFYHVHSHLSISEAAQELHITPSAVSQQIKKLEGELKTSLFTRIHKQLVPTTEGKDLFALLKPLIEGISSGIRELEEERSEPSGLLKIGAPMEFGSIYLPHVIASFRKKYQKVTFELELGRPSSLLPQVRDGYLDFAFMDTFPTKEQYYQDAGIFRIQPIVEEEVVLACSKQYDDTVLQHQHSFKKLITCPMISQQPDARAINNWFLHHFNRSVTRLNVVLTVANHQAVVSGVKNSLGLGIIVTHLVWEEIEGGSIIVVRKGKKQAINRISIVQLQDKIPTRKEKYFLKHFNKITKSTALRHLTPTS